MIEQLSTRGNPLTADFYNLPNHAPSEIFSRKYLMWEGLLTPGVGEYIWPFRLMYDHDILSNIMDKHKYFRCDGMQLDISVTAPVSMGGYLTAHWFPLLGNAPTTIHTSRDWKDFVPHDFATLSLADSESLVMNIKWQHAYNCVSQISTPTDSNPYEPTMAQKLRSLGRFNLHCVSAQQVDETTPVARARIFASYINPYIAGPRAVVENQSMYDAFATVTNAYDTVGGAAGIISGAAKTASAAKIARETFDSSKPYLEQAYCSLFDCEEDVNTTQIKAGDHIDVRQNVWGATSSLTPSKLPSLSDLPLGKPLSSEIVGTSDDINIYDLITRWCYLSHIDYDATKSGQEQSPRQSWLVTPTMSTYGYMQFYSNFFRLWRGSIDLKICLFSSPLITYQVVVSVNWDNNNAADAFTTSGHTYVGDTTYKMVTVRGTSEFEVNIPYMREHPWERVDAIQAPLVFISAFPVGSIAGSHNDIKLPMLIYCRAGSDFRFRSLVSPGPIQPNAPNYLGPPAVETQGLVDHTVSMTSMGRLSNMCESQAFHGSLRDLLAHVSTRQSADWKLPLGLRFGDLPATTSPLELADAFGAMDIFDSIASLFGFYSGSYQVKAEFSGEGNDQDLRCFLSDLGGRTSAGKEFWQGSAGNGMYRTDQTVWNFVEIEVPMISPWAMMPLQRSVGHFTPTGAQSFNYFSQDIAVIEMVSSTESLLPKGEYFINAAPDLSLHVMFPPWGSDITGKRTAYRRRSVAIPPTRMRGKGKLKDVELSSSSSIM